MNREHLKQALLECAGYPGSIAITTHIHPDGDGFCAALALGHWLKCIGRDSVIVTEADDLERFGHLMEGAKLIEYTDGMSFDLVIVLDCNSESRLGERMALVRDAKRSLLIDHHEVENLPIAADILFIEPGYVSVGAMLFDALREEIQSLPERDRIHIGDCLYTTILNDTNNFVNANTTPEVFEISAGLARLGIDPSKLYKAYFLNHTHQEMKFVGEVLSTIDVRFGGRVLYIDSSLDMQARNAVDAEAILNMTRWVQGLKGVDVTVYFREERLGLYKLSLRSVLLDVNQIAVSFGGGGHKNASGCHLSGTLSDVKEQITEVLIPLLEGGAANA